MKGKALYESYTGLEADHEEDLNIPLPEKGDSVALLGEVLAIEYDGVIDGERAYFRHEFKRGKVSMLGAGKKVLIIYGGFRLTPQGIVDAS